MTDTDLPTIVYAVKRVAYMSSTLADWADDAVTLQGMIDMALEYASEDLNDSAVSHYLIAEYRDEDGNVTRTEEYDWNGNPIT
jgi:hypothetical protein